VRAKGLQQCGGKITRAPGRGHTGRASPRLCSVQIGLMPTGTARITIAMSFLGINAGNGAADNLSLVLTALRTSPSFVLGTNLVVNGGAELGPNTPVTSTAPYIPGWSTTSRPSVAPYGGSTGIAVSDPGPSDRGTNLFCGSPGSDQGTMYQDIDVSAAATLIDAGQVKYQVSAWLGRLYGSPTVTYTFFDWSNPPKQLAPTGQLRAVQPTVGLVETSHSDTLPSGTQRVHIDVAFEGGGYGTGSWSCRKPKEKVLGWK
jgi:hypothetical protein